MVSASVVFWLYDITVSCIGIIIAIILLIILIVRISGLKRIERESSFVIYSVYIASLISFFGALMISTILPIFKLISSRTDQIFICHISYYFVIPCVGISNFCMENLFIYRLNISFKNSKFALSYCCKYGIRSIYGILWIILVLISIQVIDTSPYNIYTENIDYNNGITCSVHQDINNNDNKSNKNKIILNIMMAITMIAILINHIIIWLLFVIKLRKLLKSCNKTKDYKFIKLIQEQTLLIGITVFSTLIFWTLNIIYSFGQFLVLTDTIINIFIIFLSFSFNKDYFKLFKCNLLIKYCCKSYKQKHIEMTVNTHRNLRHIKETQTTETTGNSVTSSSFTVKELPKLNKSVTSLTINI